MTLSTGTKLAHYEISSQLGKGGLGEVYQAKDQNHFGTYGSWICSDTLTPSLQSPPAQAEYCSEANAGRPGEIKSWQV
jgi:hypothetical protein